MAEPGSSPKSLRVFPLRLGRAACWFSVSRGARHDISFLVHSIPGFVCVYLVNQVGLKGLPRRAKKGSKLRKVNFSRGCSKSSS